MGGSAIEAILLLLVEDIAQHDRVAAAMAACALLNLHFVRLRKVRIDHDLHALQRAFIFLLAAGIDVGLLGDPYLHASLCPVEHNDKAFPWHISVKGIVHDCLVLVLHHDAHRIFNADIIPEHALVALIAVLMLSV